MKVDVVDGRDQFHDEMVRWSTSLSRASVHELADRLSNAREIDSGLMYHRAHAYERPEKILARQMVVDSFSNEWRRGPASILTLPGALWHFEEALLDRREGASFWRSKAFTKRTNIIACERNEYLYRAALLKAPCSRSAIQHIELAPWSSCAMRVGPIKRFFRCSFEDMAFEQIGYKLNGAWLDFSGPVTREGIAAIERLVRYWQEDTVSWTKRNCHNANFRAATPLRLIVTAMNARWSWGSFNMQSWMASLGKVFHYHSYVSGTVPMIQVGIDVDVSVDLKEVA